MNELYQDMSSSDDEEEPTNKTAENPDGATSTASQKTITNESN